MTLSWCEESIRGHARPVWGCTAVTHSITDIRHLYGDLTGDRDVGVEVERPAIAPLTPVDLLTAMRVRSTVAVPVGVGLRVAAWLGLVLAALTAFGTPWLVDAWANEHDVPFRWIVAVMDRGDAWSIASGAVVCLGFVTMVFTNGGTRAERYGLWGLLATAVAGCVVGGPTVAALVLGLISIAVIALIGLFFGAIGVGLAASAVSSD